MQAGVCVEPEPGLENWSWSPLPCLHRDGCYSAPFFCQAKKFGDSHPFSSLMTVVPVRFVKKGDCPQISFTRRKRSGGNSAAASTVCSPDNKTGRAECSSGTQGGDMERNAGYPGAFRDYRRRTRTAEGNRQARNIPDNKCSSDTGRNIRRSRNRPQWRIGSTALAQTRPCPAKLRRRDSRRL